MMWRVNRTTAFRRPISHVVEFSLSNSQIFLMARRAASDKLYRMHKPSISLSINAFRFSSLLITGIRFEAFNLTFEVGARLSQVRKRVERLSPRAANVFTHVAKVEVQVEGFDHIKNFETVAFVVVAFFFHVVFSQLSKGARRSCRAPGIDMWAVFSICGRRNCRSQNNAPGMSRAPQGLVSRHCEAHQSCARTLAMRSHVFAPCRH